MRGKSFIILFFSLLASVCHAQMRMYRADTRSPEEIRSEGGFHARGTGRLLEVAADISMFNHAQGAANGQSRNNDGYVSTTVDRDTALTFLRQMHRGTGYIYEIASTANMIQVSGTLGQFSPFPNEHEYAAMGSITYQQITGWTQYTLGSPVTQMQPNPDFARSTYGNVRPNPGEPSLAGFPDGHPAWRLPPWMNFAAPGCGNRPGRRSLRTRQATCRAAENPWSVANKWMNTHCFNARTRVC